MQPQAFRVRGFHPLWPAFPGPFRYACGFSLHGARPPPHPYNPAHPKARGLGSSPFARRYWGNLV